MDVLRYSERRIREAEKRQPREKPSMPDMQPAGLHVSSAV